MLLVGQAVGLFLTLRSVFKWPIPGLMLLPWPMVNCLVNWKQQRSKRKSRAWLFSWQAVSKPKPTISHQHNLAVFRKEFKSIHLSGCGRGIWVGCLFCLEFFQQSPPTPVFCQPVIDYTCGWCWPIEVFKPTSWLVSNSRGKNLPRFPGEASASESNSISNLHAAIEVGAQGEREAPWFTLRHIDRASH